MLKEADALVATGAHAAHERTQVIRANLNAVAGRLDRLMTAYTEGVLSLQEYREAKNKLVEEKRQWDEKLIAMERDHSSALEPLINFVKAVKQAGILAETGTDEQKRDFLKKVPSNLTISNRHLSVKPREAWQLVVDQGRIAQSNTAPETSGAVLIGKPDQNHNMRREGDSNSRYPFGQTGFRNRRIQPLCHLSRIHHYPLQNRGFPRFFRVLRAMVQHPISLRQTAPNYAETRRLVTSQVTSDSARVSRPFQWPLPLVA
jgi:hypothetical protein